MRIHYDNIVFSLQKAGGISTYWSELITRFLRDQAEINFTEIPNKNIVRNSFFIPKEKILALLDRKPLLFSRFASLRLTSYQDKFIFHSSYNRKTNNPFSKQVVTVHDFVHEKFYSGLRRYLHLNQKNKAIRSADHIIAVSENTKKDLLYYHPDLSEKQISVIYNGVSNDFYPLKCNEEINVNSADHYLLFIGSRAQYKNFSFTIDLLKSLPDFKFYIVGGSLTKKEKLELDTKIKGRWQLFCNIDNYLLNQLYNYAYALIYPSSYEGFGIPLLEAMRAGTPFIALNKSSIPEVAGNAGILIDELDITNFNSAVKSISNRRQDLIKLGLKQALKFSWENCYSQTVSVYKALLK